MSAGAVAPAAFHLAGGDAVARRLDVDASGGELVGAFCRGHEGLRREASLRGDDSLQGVLDEVVHGGRRRPPCDQSPEDGFQIDDGIAASRCGHARLIPESA